MCQCVNFHYQSNVQISIILPPPTTTTTLEEFRSFLHIFEYFKWEMVTIKDQWFDLKVEVVRISVY